MIAKDDAWHLDKRVPLTLIVGLIVNAVFGIWFASKLDSRVSTLEQGEAMFRLENAKLRDSIDNEKERIIRVEVTLEAILNELKGIKLRISSVDNKFITQ